jgi:hypothetical protein
MNEFWAALAGALVGGMLSGATAWWTTRMQSRHERRAKQLDRLDAAVDQLQESLSDLARSIRNQRVPPPAELRALSSALVRVTSRASLVSPHLANISREWLGSFPPSDAPKEVVDANWRRFPKALEVFQVALMQWMTDIEDFERKKRPLTLD